MNEIENVRLVAVESKRRERERERARERESYRASHKLCERCRDTRTSHRS